MLVYTDNIKFNTVCETGISQLSASSSHLNLNQNLTLVFLQCSEIIQIVFKLWKSSYLKEDNKTHYEHLSEYDYRF
jgi:hypothetical protein